MNPGVQASVTAVRHSAAGRLAVLALIAAAVTLAACGDKKKDKLASQTAAKVNKEEITVHQINFVHIVRMTQAFLPAMLERQSGAIVNVSSVEGLRGYPAGIVYGAYKAAAVQLTRSLGVQLGNSGVRVNGIGPDVTNSLQVPYDKMVNTSLLQTMTRSVNTLATVLITLVALYLFGGDTLNYGCPLSRALLP